MSLNQNKTNWIIGLILIAFFVKGVFLATILPIFKGQDESRHYNTVQYLNEPEEKNWEFTKQADRDQDKDDLSTYRFSEEIRNTALKTETHRVRYNKRDTITFTTSSEGKNEEELKKDNSPAINKINPVDVTGLMLYHKLGFLIENSLEDKNIFIRFYLIRIFSVALATLFILFSFLTLRAINIPDKYNLALLLLLIFQPGLSFYSAHINYAPLLFFSFSAFIYGAVLYLKQGANWKNISLLILPTIIGLLTKGAAVVLVISLAFIIALEIFKRARQHSKKAGYIAMAMSFIILVSLLTFYSNKFLPLDNKDIQGVFNSFKIYSSETLNLDKFSHTAKTYWGVASLNGGPIIENLKYIFLWIDLIALFGVSVYLFSKKKLPEYLPEKKYVLFFILIILALQIGVRLAGWKYFDKTGDIGLGAPGRYFLPTLLPHLCLLYVGTGTIFFYLKAGKYFKYFLGLCVILMIYLSFEAILNSLIFRHYIL